MLVSLDLGTGVISGGLINMVSQLIHEKDEEY